MSQPQIVQPAEEIVQPAEEVVQPAEAWKQQRVQHQKLIQQQKQRMVQEQEKPREYVGPSFIGFVSSEAEALLLFEACLASRLPLLTRRPTEEERQDLIFSGSCFVYAQDASGISRWTDGMAWSPSRASEEFLLYRERDETKENQGGKQKATKTENGGVKKSRPVAPIANARNIAHGLAQPNQADLCHHDDRYTEKQFLGAHGRDAYKFVDLRMGLIKKTVAATIDGRVHQLVNYYNYYEAQRVLRTPTDPNLLLGDLVPRVGLRLKAAEKTVGRVAIEHPAVPGPAAHANPGQVGQQQVPPGDVFGMPAGAEVPLGGDGQFVPAHAPEEEGLPLGEQPPQPQDLEMGELGLPGYDGGFVGDQMGMLPDPGIINRDVSNYEALVGLTADDFYSGIFGFWDP